MGDYKIPVDGIGKDARWVQKQGGWSSSTYRDCYIDMLNKKYPVTKILGPWAEGIDKSDSRAKGQIMSGIDIPPKAKNFVCRIVQESLWDGRWRPRIYSVHNGYMEDGSEIDTNQEFFDIVNEKAGEELMDGTRLCPDVFNFAIAKQNDLLHVRLFSNRVLGIPFERLAKHCELKGKEEDNGQDIEPLYDSIRY